MEVVKVTEFLTDCYKNGELVAIAWGNGDNKHYACLHGIWEVDSQTQIVNKENLEYLRESALNM